MASNDYESRFPIVAKLRFVSLIAALLSVPFIVFQASSSESLETVGDFGSIAIWLYFVVEITILLRIWDDNLQFLKGHALEVIVVVASSPLFIYAYDAESLFGIAPFLRVVRFVKLAKLGKIGKAGKLIGERELPKLLVLGLWLLLGVSMLGVLGMIVDHHAHSFVEGLEYWKKSVQSGFQLDLWTIFVCVPILVIAAISVRTAHRRHREQQN